MTSRELDKFILESAGALLDCQQEDGHWVFELEADATIPAEYILYLHYLDESDPFIEGKISRYLLNIQDANHGGWPLFHGGPLDMSASVKTYFALKMAGTDISHPAMVKARAAILAAGGANHVNIFTRTLLALFAQVPWRVVPLMPAEIVLLPKWFFFHLDKVSYWSRTVIVPLSVLMSLRPKARNRANISINELFVTPAWAETHWPIPQNATKWAKLFRGIDKILHKTYPLISKLFQKRALRVATAWVDERLNGLDGLGAIFPAMVNSVLMYDAIGVDPNDQRVLTAKESIRRLLVIKDDYAYCQPCVSPVWDTALAAHALLDVRHETMAEPLLKASRWLKDKQITDLYGDWQIKTDRVAPGGWAFQYNNAHYPDVDDTAVVIDVLERVDAKQFKDQIKRGVSWLQAMQSTNGGWGAFDIDNSSEYLNAIPFADHGALLDPPTADVSARCVSVLAAKDKGVKEQAKIEAAVAYLLAEQEKDGSWFGRWGTNYIYGTWSVLCALNAAGLAHSHPSMTKAVRWLVDCQRVDGGWGEDGRSYWRDQPRGTASYSTPSQTAWAVLGLMAAGEVHHPSVTKGIAYLMKTRRSDYLWDEIAYTAVGFPRVFYLRYHGYAQFFPLWALARYRNLLESNQTRVEFGL